MVRSRVIFRFTLVVVTSLVLTGSASAQRRTQVQAGVLECRSGPSIGLIVGSARHFDCVFKPSARGAPRQAYTGSAGRVGLDIGITFGSALVWAVRARSRVLRPGALAGSYGGASASASIGVGLGANALVGGSDNTIVLQPLSVEVQGGLNLALGVQGLELHYVPTAR
jgi:hypothetical protein